MIVEDERILAISLKMDLNAAGYKNISVVSNGDDAISQVQENAVHIILMDININGDKTGIDTASSIAAFSKVPVIYLTGETDLETKSKAMATANCKGYLSKPANMKILEPMMTQILDLSLS